MASTVGSTTTSNSSLIQQLTGSSSAAQTANSAEEMQTRFLNLLVTQLKNQDPLNPMDNAQMTTQLSQISTVSGIEKLNANLSKLLESYSASQNMQAANLIGHTVLTAGSELELYSSGAIGGVSLAGAADKVTVTIKDASGKVVQTQSLGAQSAGTVGFSWDGKSEAGDALATGKYTFSVAATQAGKTVEATALQAGMVSALTMTSEGSSLQLSSGKTVNYSDIKQIM